MSAVGSTAHAAAGNRVWLLIGPKAGDNAQLRTLGEALASAFGWRIREVPLGFRSGELVLHLRSRPTLAGLDAESRDRLREPWPELILTAGRRNELVARWIRDRAAGAVRIVHLGRPWSRPRRFDLVVSTPQYRLPPAGNVLVNPLPLHRVDRGALDAAAAAWAPRLPDLPRPWIALLLGGDSGPFVFTPALAERLARQINAHVSALHGSLLVTTSPRTPDAFRQRLWSRLVVPSFARPWSPDPADNPYLAFLALADALVVTSESISMITEALATGKPTLLADVGDPSGSPWSLRPSSLRWKPLTHRLAMALAPARFYRDIGRIHADLRASGSIAWLGEPWPDAPAPVADALPATIERIARLLPRSGG